MYKDKASFTMSKDNVVLYARWKAVEAANTKPARPTITAPTTATVAAGQTYVSIPFKAKTTDPDKDKIRYGFDTNNDKKADNWLPTATTFVDSGTEVTMNFPWSASTLVVNVIAQDTKGNFSDWATHSVVISQSTTTVSQGSPVSLAGLNTIFASIDLELGQTHPSVITLQKYLNSNGYIINEVLGQPGSIGYESDYFGEKTKQALIKFQKDKGISPAEGYFGAKTRAMMGI